MLDLKELVSSLFADREKEGVRDLKSATKMVEQLPENQVLQAVTEIVKALQKMNRNPKVGVKERFRTIAYLDEKTRPLLAHLIEIFFGRKTDPSAPQRQVLLTIVAFLGEMANAYSVCLKVLEQSLRSVDNAQLQLFTLRGMLYCSSLAKWSYIRYLPVRQGIWGIINSFYLFAEQHRFSSVTLIPYAGEPETTAQREYLQCLLLSLSMPEKMRVGQIELVSTWLRNWEHLAKIETTLRPNQQTFAIQISEAAAPRRVQRDMAGDDWRYINTGKLIQHLQEVSAHLRVGEHPGQIGLPAESAENCNIQLLQQLQNLWSRDVPAPTRKDKRSTISKPVTLICGFNAITKQMTATTLTLRVAREQIMQLTAENESESGLGAQFLPKRSEQLPLGEMVGLYDESTGAINLGVVRRIACLPDGKIFTGIEFMTKKTSQAKSPMLVELTQPGKPAMVAIYSPDSAPAAKDRFLIVPHADYIDQGNCRLAIQGQFFEVRVGPPIEYTPETVRASFTVLNKISQ